VTGFARRFFIVLIFIAPVLARPAAATIRYTVSLENPEKHAFAVQMEIPQTPLGTAVALPAWNALYQVRDFSYRLRDLHLASAHDTNNSDAAVRLIPVDKQTWTIGRAGRVASGNAPANFAIAYEIEWNDPGPFNSQINAEHAFVNLAEILMYLPDRRGEDTQVTFEHVPAGWRIAAELAAGKTENTFTADSYDHLVDAPVEAGTFSELGFDAANAHFRVVIDAKDFSKPQFENNLHRIVKYELGLMGGPPFPEYTFFFHIGPYLEVGGGGMEHSNCTAISASSEPGAIAIAAHEFFHVWNVKRIRPQALEPVDYTKEQYTRALWFAEGVTSTYASFAQVRSGVWNAPQFYSDLAEQLQRLDSSPARKWQSVEESSLDAWLEKYDSYYSPDRSISYYNKGQILGVLLDIAIRDETNNKKSLDDVMRAMNEQFAKRGRFYNESIDVRATIEQVTGQSFEDFFRRYVSGVDDLPTDDFLARAGLRLNRSNQTRASYGFAIGRGPGAGWVVSDVTAGSAAESAGLRRGDEIVQLNGESPSAAQFRWLRERAPGDTISMKIRRNSQEQDVTLKLGARDETQYSIEEIAKPSEKQRRIREGMLRGSTN
jgi:predicted metalloprotease with PDZ domain